MIAVPGFSLNSGALVQQTEENSPYLVINIIFLFNENFLFWLLYGEQLHLPPKVKVSLPAKWKWTDETDQETRKLSKCGILTPEKFPKYQPASE